MITAYDNAGTATNHFQRYNLHLNGLLPHSVETIDIQKRRVLHHVRSKTTMLEKYIFLAQLRNTNIRLFYKIIIEELQEFAPVIYTPTVGTACLEYSNIYPFLAGPAVPDGLYIDSSDLSGLKETIENYKPVDDFSPEIAVITDGSRILGLGDLGCNGMGISIGKLQLYVAGAGIDPRRTLPIVLDMGTNNEKLRNDEFYLGLRQRRPSDIKFYDIADTVLKALHSVYPDMLIQFEDWSSEHAFGLLKKYQNKYACFNDDIQGTGSVILSGIINAIRKVQTEDGVLPYDHRIVLYGAGSAAIGVARQIQSHFQLEFGMSEAQARNIFWIVDSKGLVTTDRGDTLVRHKVHYARRDNEGKQHKTLIDIVNYVKPTILIGLSSSTGAFTKQVLSRLAELNQQPIVFPLSNPATHAECTFSEAMEATRDKVIFASGTAFPTYTSSSGKVCIPGQGNNMYIFPGLGLGAILSKCSTISDHMIYSASKALAYSLTTEEVNQGLIYPNLMCIREVSAAVAAAVIGQSIIEGTCQQLGLKKMSKEVLLEFVLDHMWLPSKTSLSCRI